MTATTHTEDTTHADDIVSKSSADQTESPAQVVTEQPNAKSPATISVRALVAGVVVVILVGAIGALAWLYIGAQNTLDAQNSQAADNKHAEDVALTYAVNAAVMNFQDLNTWKTKLVAGTSPELKDKLTKAADSMEQILMPLQWNSTAKPLVAKVRSESGGVYVVDSFVSVLTKTTQAPDGLQSTATYSITMDGNNNWQITDVGGIDAVIPQG